MLLKMFLFGGLGAYLSHINHDFTTKEYWIIMVIALAISIASGNY